MNVATHHHALLVRMEFTAQSPLMIRSGMEGSFTDSSLERAPDGSLHINGYVWAGLLRRALSRCRKGADYAAAWGDYDAVVNGVAPLWTTPTFIKPDGYLTDINPGVRIDRERETAVDKALYSDEIALVHASIPCCFTLFLDGGDTTAVRDALADAFWVIGEGIETIGGGWSYGLGRLSPAAVFRYRELSLEASSGDARQTKGAEMLWRFVDADSWDECTVATRGEPAAGKGWSRITVEAGIPLGQMLAIHSDLPPLDYAGDDLPDSFVFRRQSLTASGESEAIITGKAFRQAILSQEIERRLRTGDPNDACLDTTRKTRAPRQEREQGRQPCHCRRCLWFGNAGGGGIIAVGDAVVRDARTEIIFRQMLCEHSGQNVQLFNGEYLTRGSFIMEIIVDHARGGQSAELLEMALNVLLEMMPGADAPQGWSRLGATTACTGQVEVTGVYSILPEAHHGC